MYLLLRSHLINTAQCPVLIIDEMTQSWSVSDVCGEKHGRHGDPELYQALVFVLKVVLPLIHPTEATVIDVIDAYSRRDTFIAAKKQVEVVNQLNQVAAEKAIAEQQAALAGAPTVSFGAKVADDVAGRKIIPFPAPAGPAAEIDPTKAGPGAIQGKPTAAVPAVKPVIVPSGLKPIVPKTAKDDESESA